MILDSQKKTYSYICMAIFGWFCLFGLCKYIYHLIKYILPAMGKFIKFDSAFEVIILQVSVIALIGFVLALILLVLENIFSFKLIDTKIIDTKFMSIIYLIGFFSECICLIPLIIIAFKMFFGVFV